MSVQLTSALNVLGAGASWRCGVLFELAGALAPPERAALTLFLDSLSAAGGQELVAARPELAQACITLASPVEENAAAEGTAQAFATLVSAANDFVSLPHASGDDASTDGLRSNGHDDSDAETLVEPEDDEDSFDESNDGEPENGAGVPQALLDSIRQQQVVNRAIAMLVGQIRGEFSEALQAAETEFFGMLAPFLVDNEATGGDRGTAD